MSKTLEQRVRELDDENKSTIETAHELATQLNANFRQFIEYVSPFYLAAIPKNDETQFQDLGEEIAKHSKSVLKPQELDILHKRYWAGKTLKEIAKKMKPSKEKARQIEKQALQHKASCSTHFRIINNNI